MAPTVIRAVNTITRLSESLDIPVGALVRVAKWAAGSEECLYWRYFCAADARIQIAEDEDTDEARLLAYEEIRQMVQWLHLPIEDPTIYD